MKTMRLIVCILCFAETLLGRAQVISTVDAPDPAGVYFETRCNPPAIRNGTAVTRSATGQKTFAVGDKVVVNCAEGYKRKSEFLQCQSDGTWDSENNACEDQAQPFGCGLPEFPKTSGSYSPESPNGKYAVDTKLTFGCANGLTMYGSQHAYCQPSGRWNAVPECSDGCFRQNEPNGIITPAPTKGNFYTPGDTITLKCTGNYRVVGSTTATCSEHGVWNAFVGCADVCDAPTKPHMTTLPPLPDERYLLYKAGSNITFRCDQEYQIVGSKTATCLSGNAWNVPLPKCEKIVIHCKKPPQRKIASHAPVQELYNVGDKIKWSCKTGYTLQSRKISRCTEKGIFKPPKPVCRVVGEIRVLAGSYVPSKRACKRPRIPLGGTVKPRKVYYSLETDVEFFCETGRFLSGMARATCRSRGFDDNIPTCKRVKCPRPRPATNGAFLDNPKDEYNYDDEVRYICNTNYVMYGEATVKCQANGQFSSGPPLCKPPSCRFACTFVEGRSCQCDIECINRNGNDCCGDFDQFCRVLFY